MASSPQPAGLGEGMVMIRYVFDFEGGEAPIEFLVEEDSDTSDETVRPSVPDWLALGSHHCDCCTLAPSSRQTCPAALAIQPVIEAFNDRLSHETVKVTVELHEVTMQATLPTQRAVRSLVGLLLALSACPVMHKLRPMAHFHLPFGAKDHTAFRFLGMHLIAQYLRAQEGLTPDWTFDELLRLFRDLHKVNSSLAHRIRAACAKDATVNSLIILDSFADSAELRVERQLQKIRPLFAMYLK